MKLKALGWLAAACALVVVASPTAHAQGGRGGGFGFGGMGGDPTFILSMEPIQKELTLNDQQKSKIEGMAADNRDAMQDIFQMSPDERNKKLQERATANRKKIAELLEKPQGERLEEIMLQIAMQNGGAQLAGLLTRPEIAEKVELTADQKKKLEDLVSENQKKTTEIFENAQGDFQGMREKMTKLREDMKDKPSEVLTAAQKEKIEKMEGKKFDVTLLQMGPGFGKKGKGGN